MASTCPRARSPPLGPTHGRTPQVALGPGGGAPPGVPWGRPPEHLHLVRRTGAPAEQAGPGASQDELPRAPGRRWRQPGTRRLPGRAAASAWPEVAAARAPAPPRTSPPPPAPCGQHAQKTSTPRRPPGTWRTHPDPHPSNQPRQDHCKHPRSHDKQVPFSRRTSTVLANQRGGRSGGAGSTAGPVSRSGSQSAGPATGQRAWQRGHQKRRRPATSLAATGVAQRRQGRPVRW